MRPTSLVTFIIYAGASVRVVPEGAGYLNCVSICSDSGASAKMVSVWRTSWYLGKLRGRTTARPQTPFGGFRGVNHCCIDNEP